MAHPEHVESLKRGVEQSRAWVWQLHDLPESWN